VGSSFSWMMAEPEFGSWSSLLVFVIAFLLHGGIRLLGEGRREAEQPPGAVDELPRDEWPFAGRQERLVVAP
jgi:hypothetical protein